VNVVEIESGLPIIDSNNSMKSVLVSFQDQGCHGM